MRTQAASSQALRSIPSATMNHVYMRRMSGAFVGVLQDTLGKPGWLLADTSIAEAECIPATITVGDYLKIVGNMALHSPDPAYHISYMLAGVPLYRGPLDLGIRAAPNLRAVLEFVAQYANDRPGYHRHEFAEHAGRTELELVPVVDLGPGGRVLVETPLLMLVRAATRCLGRPQHEAVVELRYDPPAYLDRLTAAFDCEIRFGAARDAVSFPSAMCLLPSVASDADLWRTSLARCKEDGARRHEATVASQVEVVVAQLLAENGRTPRLTEAAALMQVSSRTLIRRLRGEDRTFQGIVDGLLMERCKVLLSDPALTIAQLAAELGFPETSGFYRRFQRWFGVTPDQYRKRILTIE